MRIAADKVRAASRVTGGITDSKELVIEFGHDVSHFASVQTGVSMAHVRIGMGRSGRHAEIGILQLGRGREGLRVALEHDRTAHQHVSAGRNGKCDCNVLLDQDAADAHLAADPVDRLVHTLDDERRSPSLGKSA